MSKEFYNGEETGMYARSEFSKVMQSYKAELVAEQQPIEPYLQSASIWHLKGVTLHYRAGFGFDARQQVVPNCAELIAHGTPEGIATIEGIIKSEEQKHAPVAKSL
jgi:hypothetical protein